MSFETTRLARLPIWLDGPNARAYQGAAGADQDSATAALKSAVKLRWPLPGCIDPADTQALFYAGAQRHILRAPNESSVGYRARLERTHLFWYWAGTAAGMLLVFEPFFESIVGAFAPPTEELLRLDPTRDATMIAIQGARGRVDPLYFNKETAPTSTVARVLDMGALGGAYWANGDPAHPWWSKIVFFLDSRGGPWTTDGTFADPGTFADEGLIGSTITQFDLSYMRRMLRRVKNPGAYPFYVAVILEGDATIGFLPYGYETIGDDAGVFGDTDQVAFLRIGHADGEGVLWGMTPDGTFGDPGEFICFEE